MEIKTHKRANRDLLGIPISIDDGRSAVVELLATEDMAVDKEGLIHGGFIFGLADYAAMLAVNHPYVVLGSSQSRFIAPVSVGDRMRVHAKINLIEGRRRNVNVEVTVGDVTVYSGKMTCFVLDRHVLA